MVFVCKNANRRNTCHVEGFTITTIIQNFTPLSELSYDMHGSKWENRLRPISISLWDQFSEVEAPAMSSLPGPYPIAIGFRRPFPPLEAEESKMERETFHTGEEQRDVYSIKEGKKNRRTIIGMATPLFHRVESSNWVFSAWEFPRIATWEYGTRKYQIRLWYGLPIEKPHYLTKQVC